MTKKFRFLLMVAGTALPFILLSACNSASDTSQEFKISLAQWSLQRTFIGDTITDWGPWVQALLASPDDVLKGDADPVARQQAVENHYPWVDVAQFLGAGSVRVNLAGSGSPEEVAANAIEGLSRLAEYAAPRGIDILVENQRGLSADASWTDASKNMTGTGALRN